MDFSSYQQATQSNMDQSIDTMQDLSNSLKAELQQTKNKVTRLEAAIKALADASPPQGYLARANNLRTRMLEGLLYLLFVKLEDPPPVKKKGLKDGTLDKWLGISPAGRKWYRVW